MRVIVASIRAASDFTPQTALASSLGARFAIRARGARLACRARLAWSSRIAGVARRARDAWRAGPASVARVGRYARRTNLYGSSTVRAAVAPAQISR